MKFVHRDLISSFRSLVRNPFVSAVTALTLCLAIASSTVIFTIVNSIILRPLPFRNSTQLVVLWNKSLTKSSIQQMPLSGADLLDIAAQQHSFDSVAAFTWTEHYKLTGLGSAQRLKGIHVTPNFLTLLGINPQIGRGFAEGDRTKNSDAIMISSGIWRDNFGMRDDVLGHSIRLDDHLYTIIGVLPPDLQLPLLDHVDVLLPASADNPTFAKRGAHAYTGLAELRAGISVDAARAELNTIAARLAASYPHEDSQWGLNAIPLLDNTIGSYKELLFLFVIAAALLIIVAAVNIANLSLTKGLARQKEFAIRLAVGATRLRLYQQLTTEYLSLAALGSVSGLALAYLAILIFKSISPAYFPRLHEIGLDMRSLIFAFSLSGLLLVLFGLLPVVYAIMRGVNDALKIESKSVTGYAKSQRRKREMLVICEVALSLALLVVAGVLVKSFYTLLQRHLGFTSARLLTAKVSLGPPAYSAQQSYASFAQELTGRLYRYSDIHALAITSNLPMSMTWTNSYIHIPGYELKDVKAQNMAESAAVTPDYFNVLSIPLLKGRSFNDGDTATSMPVAIISDTIDRSLFRGESLGHQLAIDPAYSHPSNITPRTAVIVGVVPSVKTWMSEPITDEIYVPFSQNSTRSFYVALNIERGGVAEGADTLRESVAAIDKDQLLYDIKTMNERISDALAERRISVIPVGVFAVTALLLSCIGVYGINSYLVAQRKGEIGIRIALGAESSQVKWMIVRQALTVILIGMVSGLMVALAFSKILSGLSVNVKLTDPATALIVILVVGISAGVAVYFPAATASKLDPLASLRDH